MRTESVGRLGLVVTIAAVLVGCSPSPPSTSNGDPVGQWGEIREKQPYLTINADGTVLGHDACNGMSGDWHNEEGVVHFDDMMMTLVMCEGVDTWLGAARTAIVDGDTLRVINENGEEVGLLPRVP